MDNRLTFGKGVAMKFSKFYLSVMAVGVMAMPSQAHAVCSMLITSGNQPLTAEQQACSDYLAAQRAAQEKAQPSIQAIMNDYHNGVVNEYTQPAPVANNGPFVVGGTAVNNDFDLAPGASYVTKQIYDANGNMQIAWQDGTPVSAKHLAQLEAIRTGKYSGIDYTGMSYQQMMQVKAAVDNGQLVVPKTPSIYEIMNDYHNGVVNEYTQPTPTTNNGPFVIGGSAVNLDFDLVPGIPYVTKQIYDASGNMQIAWQDGTPLTTKQVSQLLNIQSGAFAAPSGPAIQQIMNDLHNGVISNYYNGYDPNSPSIFTVGPTNPNMPNPYALTGPTSPFTPGYNGNAPIPQFTIGPAPVSTALASAQTYTAQTANFVIGPSTNVPTFPGLAGPSTNLPSIPGTAGPSTNVPLAPTLSNAASYAQYGMNVATNPGVVGPPGIHEAGVAMAKQYATKKLGVAIP